MKKSDLRELLMTNGATCINKTNLYVVDIESLNSMINDLLDICRAECVSAMGKDVVVYSLPNDNYVITDGCGNPLTELYKYDISIKWDALSETPKSCMVYNAKLTINEDESVAMISIYEERRPLFDTGKGFH